MTNAPSNSATAKPESNKFFQQDLSGFKSKDDVVTQVVAKRP